MPGAAPRVRFAPSPTGFFHVGSARTAWFNWLVARQSGGIFVLRIEDTDAERGREEWVDGIISAMHWLGMDPDEGPFRQSSRTSRYRQAVDALWEGGNLYACDCRREEIDARNKANGILTPGYDGFCRDRNLPRGPGTALRFRTPDQGITIVDDVIRGVVEFPCAAMDDFVVVKANGAPLFVLANVVDDIDMSITHVIRGEDLLPTTPKGVLVWEALSTVGWITDGSTGAGPEPTPPLPVFAHLPMLVNEQRKKLSKRRDPVAVESYRDQGYLPDAFVNYLSLLGWSPPGGEEIFDEAQAARVVPPGGREPLAGLLRRGQAHPHQRGVHPGDADRVVHRGVPALAVRGTRHRGRTRTSTRRYSPGWLRWYRSGWLSSARFRPWSTSCSSMHRPSTTTHGPRPWPPTIWPSPSCRRPSPPTRTSPATGPTMPSMPPPWRWAREWAGNWAGPRRPIRVAVTGRRVGPPLFEALEALGPERTLDRLRSAVDRAGEVGVRRPRQPVPSRPVR